MKHYSVVSVLCVALVSLLFPPTASAQAPSFARQGGVVYTVDGGHCTIGYVEPDRAWTAAHCGLNGQAVYNEVGSHIGTLRYFHNQGTFAHDVAYIQFAHGVVAEGNPLSGDGINRAPAPGETVCLTSSRTGHHCAPVVWRARTGPGEFATLTLFARPGDSGSGVFVPGRPGVVGIVSSVVWDSHGEFTESAWLPSAAQRASLPYQGRVPRKPDIKVGSLGIEDLPVWLLRNVGEPMEAMSSTSSRGSFFDNVLGVLAYLGLTELLAQF